MPETKPTPIPIIDITGTMEYDPDTDLWFCIAYDWTRAAKRGEEGCLFLAVDDELVML